MKKTLLLLLLPIAIVLASPIASHAQSYFGDHAYIALPPMYRADAEKAAYALGGHLLFIDSEEEYSFIDSAFVTRGSGWWWTGHESTGGYWTNDEEPYSPFLPTFCYRHWINTISTYPVGPGATMVLGKVQITYRSTKWVTKGYQFSGSFTAASQCRSIVEIE